MQVDRRRLLAAAAATPLVQHIPSASAQAFPSKTIRIVVPFPAGGTTDVIARLVAQRMTESMGQPVIVENRSGAGGTIGAEVMARANPDGYTMMMHNLTFPLASTVQALQGKPLYNLETDFAGVSLSANVPFMLLAHPTVPAKDLAQFAKLLQGNRKLSYNYGSTGPGSVMNVLGEILKQQARIEMTHIPFKGANPLRLELLAGRLDFGGDQLSTCLENIRKGELRALATTAPTRVKALPDVPTVRELGFPLLEIEGWNGLFAPAKTPRDVLDRLSKEAAAAARHPDVVKRLVELAADPVGSTGPEMSAMLRRQVEQFAPILRKLKLVVE
ncbi:MAG: tripartite tricarboxylate transporter substrate binding protein [Burkholderiales bacterium]|jgi:tripartite-type tricarboxylate transporter receptor subunit TctC|nr:tripartite tricarboxylate transporter substrate binding protein [Burkholderiales bacterium]